MEVSQKNGWILNKTTKGTCLDLFGALNIPSGNSKSISARSYCFQMTSSSPKNYGIIGAHHIFQSICKNLSLKAQNLETAPPPPKSVCQFYCLNSTIHTATRFNLSSGSSKRNFTPLVRIPRQPASRGSQPKNRASFGAVFAISQTSGLANPYCGAPFFGFFPHPFWIQFFFRVPIFKSATLRVGLIPRRFADFPNRVALFRVWRVLILAGRMGIMRICVLAHNF